MIKDYLFDAVGEIKRRAKGLEIESKIDELKEAITSASFYPKKVEVVEKKTNPIVIILAVIGAIASVAAIAAAVYYFLIPEDSEDFEDFDDDDFDDDDLEGDE